MSTTKTIALRMICKGVGDSRIEMTVDGKEDICAIYPDYGRSPEETFDLIHLIVTRLLEADIHTPL